MPASVSARSEMSVATTRSAKRDACIAWMPQPVPRSSTLPAGVGSISPASVIEAPPTPSTCCSPSAPPIASSPRSERIHHSPLPRASVNAYGRRSSAAATDVPSRATSPSSTAPSMPRAGSALAASSRGTGTPSTKSSASVARSADDPCSARRASSTRRAGTRWPRCSAAAASVPQSASSAPTVNRDRRRSARRRASRSAVRSELGAAFGSAFTRQFKRTPTIVTRPSSAVHLRLRPVTPMSHDALSVGVRS